MGFDRTAGERVYEGKLFTVRRDEFRHDDGGEVTREIVDHPGAVVVLPVDREQECFYMVSQPREVVGEQSLLELPAGKVDAGEEPIETARRELREEIGKVAGSWEPLKRCYASPGFSDEAYHLYLATGLHDAGARAEEDERIEVEAIPLDALDRAVARCRDAKSLVGLLLIRSRLRGR